MQGSSRKAWADITADQAFLLGSIYGATKLSHEAAHSCPCNLQTRPPQASPWMSSLVCRVASLHPHPAAGGDSGGCVWGLCPHLLQKKLAGVSEQEWVGSQIWVCSGEKRDVVVTAFPVILNFCLCSTESPLSFSSVCVSVTFMNNPSHKVP